MAFEQYWYVENKIVFVKFSGHISSEEIGEAFQVSAHFVHISENSPVHFLHDWSTVESFPKQLSKLSDASRGITARRSHIGWVAAYGTKNRFYRFLGDIFFQLFRIHFRLFATAEEALSFLQRVDQTIVTSSDKSEHHP